jgi:hypothetical protein
MEWSVSELSGNLSGPIIGCFSWSPAKLERTLPLQFQLEWTMLPLDHFDV